MDFHIYIVFRYFLMIVYTMTAVEINADNAVLLEPQGHSVSHSPWGYHATTVGGKRKNKTKYQKQKQKQSGKSNKNKRRSRYTRQKQNKRTRKQRKLNIL
jgi:hypothetical protein